VGEEHLVDGRARPAGLGAADVGVLLQVDRDGPLPGQPLPRGRVALDVDVVAPKDEQVGQDAGAGGLLVHGAGQPDRGDELSEGGDLAPGRGVGRVQRPVRGQDRDDATRAGQGQALEDEVVVQALPVRVMHRVV